MKTALVVLLFAVSVFCQGSAAAAQQSCGPRNVSFEVRLDDAQHAPAKPEPGKALVYFVQDVVEVHYYLGGVATRIALDGVWVGAVKNNSYFSFSVAPGEHHVCVHRQTHFADMTELAHFTAEAGKTYYFRMRYIDPKAAALLFGPVDRDQALYMIASDPRSISKPKK